MQSGLGLFWWRGGRLSRQLFNWKGLPRSLSSKAARQGGCKKIPGVLYPDSADFAKRSKFVAWRASVEASVSAEQLSLQVRELDANIKWAEIGNTYHPLQMDKDSIKSIRSFRKVIVRRKCSEGEAARYLLDFGKRRFIPDIVAKHGSKIEEMPSERKKYWLEEPYIPLHILKGFEEKRIARKANMTSSGIFMTSIMVKNPHRKDSFSYLFLKADRSEYYQCGHCRKDVLIREAVCCQYCKGFFHKRHVKKSGGIATAKCKYTCHKCHDGKLNICNDGKLIKTGTANTKSQLQKTKKASEDTRHVRSKMRKKGGRERQLTVPKTKRNVSTAVPLRRSTRKIKFVTQQIKKAGGIKKWKKTKSKKGRKKKPKETILKKKRTVVNRTYWLNGLHMSKKPNDERVEQFRSKNYLVPFDKLAAVADRPKCNLCRESEFTPTLNYIFCEICGDWFHGDAFVLKAEDVGNLIGFKCHKCRNRYPPLCPYLRSTRRNTARLSAEKQGE